MNIAQSQIAGEDTLRLHDTNIHAAELAAALADDISYGDTPAESDAIPDEDCPDDEVDFVVDETRLPYIVLQANHRARSLTTLPRRARNTLAAIALTVDQHQPLRSVFARRPYLANRAGQSLRTLQRGLTDLLAAGMIRSEDEQNRKGSGEFAGRFIYLTEMAARLLGFLQPLPSRDEAKTDIPSSADQPSATLSGRSLYRFYQGPSSQKRQPGDLPEDVKPLQAMGFSKFYIFALMRSARVEHGKRLGDIVAVAAKLIAKAKYPRAYLATLLRSPTDFGFLARQRRDAANRAIATAEAAQAHAELQARIAGQVFYERDATTRYAVSTDGTTLTVRDPQEVADRIAGPGWIAGVANGLRSAKLLPATPALDARFAERLADGLTNGQRAPRETVGTVGATSFNAQGAAMAGTTSVEPGAKHTLRTEADRATGKPGGTPSVSSVPVAEPARRERSAAMQAGMAELRALLAKPITR
ncbi:hypothetical protein [Cupriavidus pampae]|nr:hypothetical protein [Cupriavidus pampae]